MTYLFIFWGHLEISASALAPASAFEYKYSFLHRLNSLES